MTTITASLREGTARQDRRRHDGLQDGADRNRSGDIEAAVDWLRKKGLSKAAKKAGRIAAEGLIGIVAKGTRRRHRRGQLGNRLRRAQRAVPGRWCATSPGWRRQAEGRSRRRCSP